MIALSIIVVTTVTVLAITVYRLWNPEPFTLFDQINREIEFGLGKSFPAYEIYKEFGKDGQNMPFLEFVAEYNKIFYPTISDALNFIHDREMIRTAAFGRAYRKTRSLSIAKNVATHIRF